MEIERNTENSLAQTNDEYVELIENLYSQIDCYKVEYEKLKGELKLLISENQSLSNNVRELINNKIEHVDISRNEEIENLQSQIEILSQEKKYTHELWQNSLQIIQQLEDELFMYRGGIKNFVNKTEVEKIKASHSKEIIELQNKIQTAVKELSKTKKSYIEFTEERKDDLQLALRKHKEAIDQIKDLENEIIILKEKLNESKMNINGVENTVIDQGELIENLKQKEYESKLKVAEAISVAEAAIMEKNNSVMRENETKEELKQLTKTMQEIIKEAGEKVDSEINIVKEECNKKIKDIFREMKNIKQELNEKRKELENEIKLRKNLEDELHRLKFGSAMTDDEKNLKILNLEKNLESTFQKLILSERRVVQLTSDRESLKMDLDQITENFSRASKENENEKRDLLLQLKQLKQEIANYNLMIDKYETTIKDLTTQAQILEQELKNKLCTQNTIFKEAMEEEIRKITNENLLTKNELQDLLKTEQSLNKRWQSEMKDITEKLQHRIKELKHDNTRLRKHLQNTVNPETN